MSLILAAMLSVLAPLGEPPAATPPNSPSPTEATRGMREIFPGVRVDVAEKLVEFDGTVPIDAHRVTDKGEKLVVFLETIVCTKNSKEHESLVVTSAKASQVHAALLLIGLKPGAPGRWERKDDEGQKTLVSVPPRGDSVRVTVAERRDDGTFGPEIDALEWVIDHRDGRGFRVIEPDASLVFAGSAMVRPRRRMIDPENTERPEVYAGDTEGTVVGLTSFGTETIGVTAMYNPDAATQEPQWIAATSVPKVDTRVVVRVRPER